MRIIRVFIYSILVGVALFSSNHLAAEPFPLRFAQAPTTETPMPTADEFKRMHAYIVNGGENQIFPREIGVRLGWGRADISSWRRGLIQRRIKDGALMRHYAADVPKLNLARRLIVISQLVPGDPDKGVSPDTTATFVYDENGRIVRTFEVFPKENFKVVEIADGSTDKLGYDIWRFVLSQLDKLSN